MPMKSTETMDYLAERIRSLIGDDPRVTEKSMFGGLTFLLNGHILVGTKKDGRILLSVGKENNDAALRRPGATPMVHNNRTMTGFVWVEADAIEDDDDLRDWVNTAYGWVANMPASDPKARPRKAPAKTAPAPKAAQVPARKTSSKVPASKIAPAGSLAKQAAKPRAKSPARSRRAPA